MTAAPEAAILPERARWGQAWTSGEAPPPTAHAELLAAAAGCLAEPRGRRVLEVGVGSGADCAALAARGAEAYALDFTVEALRLADRTGQQRQVRLGLIGGDTLRLPFADERFDLVYSQGLLEHFSDPLPVVREQARVVRPGGFLLVDVPQRYSLYTLHKRRLMRQGRWFAGWEGEFSLGELKALLRRAGLRPLRSYGQGYYPAPLLGVRNLHTLDERRGAPILPRALRDGVERAWRALERAPWYHRFMQNIGVVAEKA